MKTSSLLVASVVLFGLVACSSGSTGTGNGTSGGGGGGLFGTGGNGSNGGSGGTSGGLGGITGSGGNGTCDQACTHYLQCKGAGWDTPQNQSTCVQNCNGLGATPDQLANFVALDCPTAVQTIEGTGNTGTSGGTGSSSSGAGADCNGCVWDGGSCIYLTGSGGNYFACASSCCPGH